RGRGHGGDEGASTPARTAGGPDHAEAVEHAQGLADAGATDAELVREIAFGRQGVADRQRAGHDLLLDGVDDQLIGVRSGHGSPPRPRGRDGAVESLQTCLVPFATPGLCHPAIMSCPSFALPSALSLAPAVFARAPSLLARLPARRWRAARRSNCSTEA